MKRDWFRISLYICSVAITLISVSIFKFDFHFHFDSSASTTQNNSPRIVYVPQPSTPSAANDGMQQNQKNENHRPEQQNESNLRQVAQKISESNSTTEPTPTPRTTIAPQVEKQAEREHMTRSQCVELLRRETGENVFPPPECEQYREEVTGPAIHTRTPSAIDDGYRPPE